MRNLITGLLLLGSIYWVWDWQGRPMGLPAERGVVSIESGLLPRQASIGWQTSSPKPRAFVAAEQKEVVEAAPAQFPGMTPVEAAQAYLENNKQTWNIQPHHEYKPVAVQSPMGSSVRFQFSQDGIPITGMYISIDMGQNNEVRAVENTYRPMESADMKAPMLSAEDVSEKLVQRYQPTGENEPSVTLYAGSNTLRPEPAYSIGATEVSNDGHTRRPVKLLVRASDGQVLDVSYERAEIQNQF